VSAAAANGAASGQGGDVHVDRLTLRVAGLDEDAARSLARLVAEGLAPGLLQPTGTRSLDCLRVQVTTDQRAPDLLARRIAGEVGRVLARDRVAGGPDGEESG
jgi:hypothetical protein